MKKKVFDTKRKTAAALAEEIYRRIVKSDRLLNIALSGGSTPALLFSILAGDYRDKIDWNKAAFYWVDERSVPPDDDQSNYKMTFETLLSHIDIPESHVFRIHGENNTEDEAERYSEVIQKTVPMENNLPVFDIILLGIGDDGHTASIFPDQMDLLNSEKVCEKAVHPESGQERVTLTGPVINKGISVYFLVCGKSKAEIINKILNGDREYPASYIQSESRELYYFLDKEAAGDFA